MAEEIGIVMSLYDKVSDTLKAIGSNTKAFSKDMDQLEESAKTYDTVQKKLGDNVSDLKSKLAASSKTVKDATDSWKKHGDAMSEKAMNKAIADQVKWQQELKDSEEALKTNRKAFLGYCEDIRKNENRTSGGDGAGGANVLSQLAKAGFTKMVGDSLSNIGTVFAGSAGGSEAGTMFSSMLSGAASGAAMGSLFGPIGTAIGGALGGLVGTVNGATEVFTQRDEAFKSYVQENTEAQLSARDSDIQSGSATAGQREQDAIAFNRLLGDGEGDKYLSDLRSMAAQTPMEYGDLTTMSRSLATGFKDDPGRMLGLMGSIGDAGSAVGVDASGMNEMAKAMSRMQASGKVTLEYLNLIQERGVDAVGMLSEGLGKTKGEVYDLISKGKLDGVEAVQVLQDKMDEWYGGAMEKQSETFSGLSSTLSDAETEMRNAYGEGYNEKRSEGIAEQTNWLSGASGEAQQEANKAIGAWQASLENSKEKFIRDAVDGAMETDEYRQAKLANDAAEMGRILMEAKVKGQSEYNASEGAQLALESELSLAASIRDDSASNTAFWDAGRRKAEEFTKGLAATIRSATPAIVSDYALSGGTPAMTYDSNFGYSYVGTPHAAGLNRVPYDDYPALLHEGERVLTAREARQQDGGGGGVPPLQIDIHDNQFSGTAPEQARQIAQLIAGEIVKAKVVKAPK